MKHSLLKPINLHTKRTRQGPGNGALRLLGAGILPCHPGQGSCPRALREGRRGTMVCPHPCPDGRAAAERSTVRKLPRTADIKKAGGFGHRLFHICQARALPYLLVLRKFLARAASGELGYFLMSSFMRALAAAFWFILLKQMPCFR